MNDRRMMARLPAVILGAGCALLLSSDRPRASNTALRFAKTLVLAGTGTIGDNWISLPFSNAYPTAAAFCTKTGLVIDNPGGGIPGATVTVVDPNTGVATSGICGTPSAASVSIPPGWGIRVRQPNVAGAKPQIFISGAHDPTVHISVSKKRSSGTYPGYWYSLPYNSTAQTYEDLCTEIGMTTSQGALIHVNAATGADEIFACTSIAAKDKLPTGDAIEILAPDPRTFTPAVD
jgi:hypothetical protein